MKSNRSLSRRFVFSPVVSSVTIALAALMLFASSWQWNRYKFKTELLQTYANNEVSPPLPLPQLPLTDNVGEALKFRVVAAKGRYDYANQVAIKNRKHPRYGPGLWLLTPFELTESTAPGSSVKHIMVSRGYIPFEDLAQHSWDKYNFYPPEEVLRGIVQPSTPARSALAPAVWPDERGSDGNGSQVKIHTHWLYPDLAQISKQLPYPIETDFFMQRLGPPPAGEFPAESVSLTVPPSTHFGYTIEWILLAVATLAVGILLQSSVWRDRRVRHRPPSEGSSGSTFPSTLCIGFLTSLYSCWVALPANEAAATPAPNKVPEQAALIERLNEFVNLRLDFANQQGEVKPLGDQFIPDRPLVILPVYYRCPRLCGLTHDGFVEALRQLDLKLGEDFKVISVSFDPKETPELAAEQEQKIAARLKGTPHQIRGWGFLTGLSPQISELMQSIGFRYEQDGADFIHTSVAIIVTPQGKISRYLAGIRFEPRDLRFSLVEAAKGKIGSKLDQFLLFCFRFDHLTGRYSLAAWRITQAICVAVAAGLAGLLIVLRRKEQRCIGPSIEGD